MQDGIIKGTGNSRYLKSISNFLTQYPTYQDFVAALVAGTLPIDLNGINETGWDQLGTALNKANLLSDETATALGLSNTAVPDDAFMVASKVLQAGNCKIEYGSYTGTGNYGITHPNSLTFSGQPLLVLVADTTRGSFLLMMRSATSGLYVTADSEGIGMPHLNWETDCAVSWYSGGPSSVNQANGGGRKYVYIALIAADE